MRLHGMQFKTTIFFMLATSSLATPATAQLSSSVGGSISAPLDSNLNGLDSSVAPIPSSTIEPGANSLLTPEEHVLPYDAIGASVVATPLTPSINQYYFTSRFPYQVDNSLRDASFVTGLHQAQPGAIVDNIPRTPGRTMSSSLLQSSWSGINSSPASSLSVMPGRTRSGQSGNSAVNQQSKWKAGSSSVPSLIAPYDQSSQASQQPSRDSKPGQNEKDLKHKETDRAGGTAFEMLPQPEERDYSRSPLERIANDEQGSVNQPESIFNDLNKKSFLNTDIFQTHLRRKASVRESDSYSRKRQADLSEPQALQNRRKAATTSGLRAAKYLSGIEQVKQRRWHNPILQQMEHEKNSARQ